MLPWSIFAALAGDIVRLRSAPATAFTVVLALELLFAAFGSLPTAVTLTLLFNEPALPGVTVIVGAVEPPAAIVPRSHETECVPDE